MKQWRYFRLLNHSVRTAFKNWWVNSVRIRFLTMKHYLRRCLVIRSSWEHVLSWSRQCIIQKLLWHKSKSSRPKYQKLIYPFKKHLTYTTTSHSLSEWMSSRISSHMPNLLCLNNGKYQINFPKGSLLNKLGTCQDSLASHKTTHLMSIFLKWRLTINNLNGSK